ncbi:MAG: peptidoglycan-associated lipoprotein Pal [Nitrospirae bacterium]|nr:peptidoglycan-associated lipoprotein Pal [Nitrospirota bacterium]
MKKIILVLLMVLAIGCQKKQVVAPEEKVMPKEPVKQEAPKAEAPEVKREVVREIVPPKTQEAALPVKAEPAKDVSSIFKDVLFDFDKYSIRDDGRPTLDAIASYLKQNGQVNIAIEGNCDERGTNEYNLALGERRAKAAKDYLSSLGVSPSRISVVTYGEEKPICTEQDETCWQKNRRDHFVASGK